jgi:hypothetical protein
MSPKGSAKSFEVIHKLRLPCAEMGISVLDTLPSQGIGATLGRVGPYLP